MFGLSSLYVKLIGGAVAALMLLGLILGLKHYKHWPTAGVKASRSSARRRAPLRAIRSSSAAKFRSKFNSWAKRSAR
jgi:hypothetical protein